MSNYKKKKERAIKMKEHKKKCCKYCSQLYPGRDGNYRCEFSNYKGELHGACLIVNATDIEKHRACFDEWNGKNLRTKEEYYRSIN